MRKVTTLLVLSVMLGLPLFAGGADEAPVEEVVVETGPQGVIVLADISEEPIKKIRRFQPLADYLAARLHDYGIGVGEVVIAADMPSMSQLMLNGQVDLYFDSPFPAMMVCDASGSQPILRRWKGGVAEYHSVFFAPAKDGITTLAGLNGKLIAYEEPYSTSGFMLPQAHLIENGFNPVQSGPGAMIAPDRIGYVFAEEDENIVQWVLEGRTAAGVLDEQSFLEIPPGTRETLNVIARTETVARQVAVVRPGMDPELIRAITTILQEMDESEEGRAVLEVFKTEQFDPFPDGAESAFVRMRAMFAATQ